MKIGESIHGFELVQIEEVKQIKGVFYEMKHTRTGARLGWMKRDDSNKTFSITFPTIPEDNTGVFHMLEHSVLQGSKHYPVKAPFVEMIKTSLNTFLNAMTFPDKTMFPVSSRNEKDFENLIHIYMDAVFYPALHENEYIFLQEGWHYAFEEEDSQPFYTGVVYNEMRGENASVDTLLSDYLNEALFPDNCYRYVSGGRPADMTSLSYEAFKEAHRRFYRPAQSIILLDGDLELAPILKILDEEYLADFPLEWNAPLDTSIPLQAPTGRIQRTYPYPVSEEGKDQGYLTLGYVCGDYSEQKKSYAIKILIDYLTDSNESVLTKALLQRGLAGDVEGAYVGGTLQAYAGFVIRNMDPANRQQIEELVHTVLSDLYENGLDKEQLRSFLDQLEFYSKESDYGEDPAGLIHANVILNSWMYGGSPCAFFDIDHIFEELRQEIEDGIFEEYLKACFLDNDHVASIALVPEDGLLEAWEQEEARKIKEFYDGLSAKEKEDLYAKQLGLKEWQEREPDKEELACLPRLELSDVKTEPVKLPIKVLSDGTLWHAYATKGIRYLRFFIPVRDFEEKELPCITFVSSLFGELPLRKMDRTRLDNKRRSTFGMADTFFSIITEPMELQQAQAYYVMDISYLKEKEEEAIRLLSQMVCDVDYDNVDMITELLYQQKEACDQALMMAGHQLAMLRVKATMNEKSRLVECAGGMSFGQWVDWALAAIEEDPAAFCSMLSRTAAKLLRSVEEGFASMTSDGEEVLYSLRLRELFLQARESMEGWETDGRSLDGKDRKKEPVSLAPFAFGEEMTDSLERIPITSQVGFGALAFSIAEEEKAISGCWPVIAKMLSMGYLWNQIRVLGGAYGTGMHVDMQGTVGFYTYRDPQPEHSLKVCEEVGDYLEEYAKSDPDLTGIIIGTLAETEPIFSPYAIGRTSDEWYLCGITDELRQQRRMEMIHTTREDLLACAAILQSHKVDKKGIIVGP